MQPDCQPADHHSKISDLTGHMVPTRLPACRSPQQDFRSDRTHGANQIASLPITTARFQIRQDTRCQPDCSLPITTARFQIWQGIRYQPAPMQPDCQPPNHHSKISNLTGHQASCWAHFVSRQSGQRLPSLLGTSGPGWHSECVASLLPGSAWFIQHDYFTTLSLMVW